MAVTNGSGMTVTSDSAVTTQTNTIQWAYDSSTLAVSGTINYYKNDVLIYAGSNSFTYTANPQFMGYKESGIKASDWNSPGTSLYEWKCDSSNWQTDQNVKLVLADSTSSAWGTTKPRVNLNSAEGIAITENGSVVYSDSSFSISSGDTITMGSGSVTPPSSSGARLPPPPAFVRI